LRKRAAILNYGLNITKNSIAVHKVLGIRIKKLVRQTTFGEGNDNEYAIAQFLFINRRGFYLKLHLRLKTFFYLSRAFIVLHLYFFENEYLLPKL
jgi:hypothetical protein